MGRWAFEVASRLAGSAVVAELRAVARATVDFDDHFRSLIAARFGHHPAVDFALRGPAHLVRACLWPRARR